MRDILIIICFLLTYIACLLREVKILSSWQNLFGSFSGSFSLFILIYIQGEVFVMSIELIVFAALFCEVGCSALIEFAHSAVLV